MRSTLLLGLILASACNYVKVEAPKYPTDTTTTHVVVASVQMATTNLSLQVGQTATLSATVVTSPAAPSGFDLGLVWKSSDSTIASVNQAGAVTGIKVGSVQVRAISHADQSKYATATVVVISTPSNTSSPVKEISFSGDSVISVKIGANKQMPQPKLVMNDTTASRALVWMSANPMVITVDSLGVVRGVSVGSALICAQAAADHTFMACYPHAVQVVE